MAFDVDASIGVPGPARAPRFYYASWLDRVVAFAVDMAGPAALFLTGLLLAPGESEQLTRTYGGTAITVTVDHGPGMLFWVCLVLAFGFDLWNRGYREGLSGQSLGKQLMGLESVRDDTSLPAGQWAGVGRSALSYADFLILYIGVLWPLWDPKRQALISDKVTHTVVVRLAR